MIKVVGELSHREVWLAAKETTRFFQSFRGGCILPFFFLPIALFLHDGRLIGPYILTNLAIKLLLLIDPLHSIASLMKGRITGITINHLISIIGFRTKANLAIGLKQSLEFL